MMEHFWDGGSCRFCGIDDHDEGADDLCPVDREPVTYTTETPA